MAERKRSRSNGEGAVYPVQRQRMRKGQPVMVTIYEGYVTLSVAGGQKRKYVTAATKQECNTKVRELLNRKDEGTLTTTKSPTVRQWVEHYLNDLAPNKPIAGRSGNRRSTLATYKGYAKNHVYPMIGKVKLERLTVEHLESVYQRMADEGMASSSIKQCHAMLRTALKVAWQRGRLPRNLGALVMLPGGKPAPDVREVTLDEAQAVLTVAGTRRMPARWLVRLAYGLRQGEALGLTWDAVDFDKSQILIRQQLQRDRAEHGCGDPIGEAEYTTGAGDTATRPAYPCGKAQPARCPKAVGGGLQLLQYAKTPKSLAPLPLPAPIAELLKARRTEQKRERIQAGPRWVGWEVDGVQADLVFTTLSGKPLEPRADYDEWMDVLDEAGVERIKPHAMRHFAATLLVALKVEPKVIQAMLRHASISTSMNVYAKAPAADLSAAAAGMADLLLGKADKHA